MCGGHELHHLIGAVAAAPATQPTDVTQTVKLMYAQGEIDTETFHRLITMAQGGYLQQADLLHVGGTASHDKHLPPEIGMDTRSSVDAPPLDSRLQELQSQLSRLLAQAEEAGKAAQRPNLTNEQVEGFLEASQGALFRAQAVQREIAAYQEGC